MSHRLSVMVSRRTILAAALLGLCAAAPARAGVEKFMRRCSDPRKSTLCPFFRPSVAVPDGWVEDKAATWRFDAVIIVPKGVAFNDAQAVIYAIAVYNRDKEPLAKFLPDAVADWKDRAKDARISDLPDLPRGSGKPAFVRRAFEGPGLKEQGFELQAVTVDGDNDGNEFIVTITLSANSREALQAAEPAYLAILGQY